MFYDKSVDVNIVYFDVVFCFVSLLLLLLFNLEYEMYVF